jgi:Carboxypeptidase regulatory-like domain
LSAGAAKAQQSITLREGQLGVSAIAWQQVRRDTIPISGRVIRQETLTALDGAIVALLDSAGHQLQRVGVGADGEFRFVGLRPGSFRLRVLRIGYEIANAVVILPLGGSVRVTAVMSLRPLE